ARAGRLDVDDIDEEWLSGAMYTAGIPDPDLLIRTGGEARVSNFLLWQLAYAEIWFTPVCWPDFRRRHLLEAVVDFQQRERKFGRVCRAAPQGADGCPWYPRVPRCLVLRRSLLGRCFASRRGAGRPGKRRPVRRARDRGGRGTGR